MRTLPVCVAFNLFVFTEMLVGRMRIVNGPEQLLGYLFLRNLSGTPPACAFEEETLTGT